MYRFILISFIVIFFASCSAGKNTSIGQVGLRELPGYSVRTNPGNKVPEYNVITKQSEFDKLFVNDTSAAPRPDFRGQVVVVLLPGKNAAKINFTKAEIYGKTMNVYFENTQGETNSNTVIAATIPRCQFVNKVNFYKGNNLVKTLTTVI